MDNDYYAVLGLKKECTETELRNAYKKLALKWHPDRCSASGNSKFVDEAKKKFQAIQEAYSVLSDANKRFLYDVGVYDSGDDDDENASHRRGLNMEVLVSSNYAGYSIEDSLCLHNCCAFAFLEPGVYWEHPLDAKGMGDFLNEMAAMMSQNKSNENQEETFEELQDMFDEIFNSDNGMSSSSSSSSRTGTPSMCSSTSSSETFFTFSNKRSSGEMKSGKGDSCQFQGFCEGTGGTSGKSNERERSWRKNSKSGRKQ